MTSAYPAPQQPASHPSPAKPGRPRWVLPTILGCGCLTLLIVVAVIVALVMWLMSTDQFTPGVQAETQRLTFTIPERWEEGDISHVTSVRGDGYTIHEQKLWEWNENADDPMAREIANYQFYGQDPQPRTTKASESAIDQAIDEGIKNVSNASEQELLSTLSTQGHGCFSDARIVGDVTRIDNDDLTGLMFTFDCVGSQTGQLGIRGVYGQYLDEYGDRHLITVTTDTENFKKKEDEFRAVVKEIEVK